MVTMVNPNYYQINVETERKEPIKNFNFYKKIVTFWKMNTLKYDDLETYNHSR